MRLLVEELHYAEGMGNAVGSEAQTRRQSQRIKNIPGASNPHLDGSTIQKVSEDS